MTNDGITRDEAHSGRGSAACSVCGSHPSEELARFARKFGLTPRELEVARCAATGSSSAEIAEHLYVSTRTVEGHLLRAYQKLGVHSRVRLALTLERLGD
jgi:DNA-binding CsgD family transcriptional regulator